MKVVLQRVSRAKVEIEGEETREIGFGLMVLIGVMYGDTEDDLKYITEKTAGLRIFDDENGVMNRSLMDVGGEMLLISQFTLLADTKKGKRPSYIAAGDPKIANAMYEKAAEIFRGKGIPVKTGTFGADMQVSLTNNGPVTIIIDSRNR
ncbi:MAG: D-tyrosyl-tRNA(Tyr) deacylase [Christensenellaceae bacterium]|nr:D-tyrosyl-tRNA(Tyr) deacylase [Christensenellaceae bacterium]